MHARHPFILVVACIAGLAMLALDVDRNRLVPVLATASADDDGGGRGGRQSRNRGDDHYGHRIFRPWRNRQARLRRAPSNPLVQAQYEPRMLIARGLSDETVLALGARGYQVVERHALGATTLHKLRVPSGRSLTAARSELRAADPRALVDFNHYYRPDALECEGRRCLMRQISGWPRQTIPATTCRPVAPIGLIDTRINVRHASLAGSRITVLPLFDPDTAPSGAHHGTAVAALLVGRGEVPGLLPNWELVTVDAFRKGDIATGYDLARAIELLAASGVPVINMSLSGPENAILSASVADAIGGNILVIAAAGNDGPRAKPAFPAAYPGVLAVTAVDQRRNVYRRAAQGAHIDIAAPGVNVWTAASVKGQRPRSGTSFAAPFVTAAAALILAENPGFGRREIEVVLENEADDLGDVGRDDTFGWGLLDIRKVCSSG